MTTVNNPDSYRVGGKGKSLTLQEALAKASRIHQRTGAIVSVEQVPTRKRKP